MAMTLLGVGLGSLVVGVLSDVFTVMLGAEALRYALAVTGCLCLVPTLRAPAHGAGAN